MKRQNRLLATATPLLAAMLLAQAGCAAPPPPEPPAPVAGGSCDASKAQFAVGREPGLAIQDQARERAGARTVRTLRPGQAITMEYSGDRLNLELDTAGKVVRVRCG